MDASIEDPPLFNITPSQLAETSSQLVYYAQEAVKDIIGSVSPEAASFENTVVPFAVIENEIKGNVQYIALFQSVSTDPEIRKASSAATNLVNKAYLNLFRNQSLFSLIHAVHSTCSEDQIIAEDKKYLEHIHSLFWNNGVGLESSAKGRFCEVSDRLVELQSAFMENLGADPGFLWKNEDELDGLSAEDISKLPQNSTGHRGILLKKSQTNYIISKCHDSSTRRDLFLGNQNSFPENARILKEALILRDEAARSLGFQSFAHQRAKNKMLESPEAIYQMLDGLSSHLIPAAQKELHTLQHLKACSDGRFYLWDFDYYHEILLREKYSVDNQLISEYFPAAFTVGKMLNIFEHIFGLSIMEIEDVGPSRIWHKDVRVFRVKDQVSLQLLGFLYVDIFQRDGKYNHAANFNIYPTYTYMASADKPVPIVCTALVCNLSQSSLGKPVLLKHREVITLFHELGHGIHDLLGRSKYATFHGHRTVADFTEAPSQFLEYWCWVPECLQELSCHYSHLENANEDNCTSQQDSRPPRQLPQSLAQSLAAAKSVNQAILTLRQVAFSKFDMQIHHPPSHDGIVSMNLAERYGTLLQKTTLLSGPSNDFSWGNGYAITSHYMWGQEANYYSYVYTRMLAADLWYSSFASHPMSSGTGMRYRKLILELGGRGDVQEAIKDLLGRAPSFEAYLKELASSR